MDAAKDMLKTVDNAAEGSANSVSDDILEAQTEPDSNGEEACQQSEYEVGIIENYYDAEDPAEDDSQVIFLLVSPHS